MTADESLTSLTELAYDKQELSKKEPFKFFIRAFLAGIFIAIGVTVSYSVGALLFPLDAGIAKIANAASMSVALLLIVFIGGELFTGMNFIMSAGFYSKRCSVSGVMRVWLLCWFGNFAACIIFSLLFVLCGTHSQILRVYMTETVITKLSPDWLALIIRGVFANFCVCCGVLASNKMKSEAGKIAVIVFCIFAFIACGFEHCIANMSIFTIAVFYADGFELLPALCNLLFTSVGNILGGAVMLGLPYYYISKKGNK